MKKLKIQTIKLIPPKGKDIMIQKIGTTYILDQPNYNKLKKLLDQIYKKEDDNHE